MKTILICGFLCPCKLERNPSQEEAEDQLMRTNELEELQEEAHAAHHQGDYSTTISVLARVIEVQYPVALPWGRQC